MLPTRSQIIINRGLIAETGEIPTGMQMIRDTFVFQPLETKIIKESMNGANVLKITGIFQEGDKENANGRVYPTKEVLVPAVNDIREDVAQRAVVGELDHPADAKIHMDRISHLITNIWVEGRKVYGEAEVLDRMPCGAMLKGLFEHKVRVGISSRGVGDMEMVEAHGHETYRVLPGYTFVTWDAVSEPSVRSAIMHIKESVKDRFAKKNEKSKIKPQFEKVVYESMLVDEIKKYFNS
jgi:hypothetical protein